MVEWGISSTQPHGVPDHDTHKVINFLDLMWCSVWSRGKFFKKFRVQVKSNYYHTNWNFVCTHWDSHKNTWPSYQWPIRQGHKLCGTTRPVHELNTQLNPNHQSVKFTTPTFPEDQKSNGVCPYSLLCIYFYSTID